MIFGTFFDPFTREFWGLWTEPDKLFAIKHKSEHKFMGYKTLKAAELARKPEESIFQFHNGAWHRILFALSQADFA